MRRKRGISKLERFSIRTTVLIFWSAFLSLVLLAENFAHYRYDYVFRRYLPTVLPILAGLALVGLIVAVVLLMRQKGTYTERIINLPFVVYLLVPLVLTLGLPACVMKGVGFNIFKLTTQLLFYFYIGYGVAYVLYHLRRPGAGVQAVLATLFGLLPICYYTVYRSPSAPIMMSVEYAYLTPLAAAAVFAGGLLLVELLALFLQKLKPRLRMPGWVSLVPFALSVICLFGQVWLPVNSDVFAAVAYGNLALQVAFLVVAGLLKKSRK